MDLPESVLVYGNYRSCGCMKRENQKQISKKLHMIDGTVLRCLRSGNTGKIIPAVSAEFIR